MQDCVTGKNFDGLIRRSFANDIAKELGVSINPLISYLAGKLALHCYEPDHVVDHHGLGPVVRADHDAPGAMARNARDSNLAFLAAESALKDAEALIETFNSVDSRFGNDQKPHPRQFWLRLTPQQVTTSSWTITASLIGKISIGLAARVTSPERCGARRRLTT